jgi:NAD(P)-dependent dehydrogenase (short-subunit alcohol dehydrogenase family)
MWTQVADPSADRATVRRMAIVLVTGCSSGFGLEIALAFARRGDQVVATMRDLSRSEALRRRVAEESLGGVSIEQLDVTRPESVQAAVRQALAQHRAIDVLVNNAGIGAVGALEVIAPETFRDVFETNVLGALAVTRAVLPSMRERRHGRIVFMSAIGGLLNTPYLGAYCASKHALDCLAATFDIELRPFGIRASSVCPSAFQTPMADNLRAEMGQEGAYAAAAREYYAGLLGRIRHGPGDLSPVVDAVVEAATSDDPRPRYLVAPHLSSILGPLVQTLEELHARELSLAPSGSTPS